MYTNANEHAHTHTLPSAQQTARTTCNNFVRNKKSEIKTKVLGLVVNVNKFRDLVRKGLLDEDGEPVDEVKITSFAFPCRLL